MNEQKNNNLLTGKFYLNKWFLDFVGDSGEAMIFYAAKLTWHGLSAFYTSWLSYNASSGIRLKSGFRNIDFPEITDDMITWEDKKFGVSGVWVSMAEKIQDRIFESEEGVLDWKCHQPASKVKLRIGEKVLEGKGYVEQLILTAPPWKIPMEELRWGRFGSDSNTMVWIELRERYKKQWLWLNGEKIENCIIEDHEISLPERSLKLTLDRGITLESEKKILSVVEKLVKFIPGFKKILPISFLMADECKWLSHGILQNQDSALSQGIAIHELVNFRTFKR